MIEFAEITFSCKCITQNLNNLLSVLASKRLLYLTLALHFNVDISEGNELLPKHLSLCQIAICDRKTF